MVPALPIIRNTEVIFFKGLKRMFRRQTRWYFLTNESGVKAARLTFKTTFKPNRSYSKMARFPFSIPTVEAFAIPSVSVLILFLSYSSQCLFHFIEPGPLSRNEALWFNLFVLGIWWCYNLACTSDPGPKGWAGSRVARGNEVTEGEGGNAQRKEEIRWCKKCDAPKPPRAHHCRQCGRYVSQTLRIVR